MAVATAVGEGSGVGASVAVGVGGTAVAVADTAAVAVGVSVETGSSDPPQPMTASRVRTMPVIESSLTVEPILIRIFLCRNISQVGQFQRVSDGGDLGRSADAK